MRSYDPWDACVTMVKSWGDLKWVMAVLMERLLSPGQLHPSCPIVTSDMVGAGCRDVCLVSWLLSWRGPKRERNAGRVRQETERSSQRLRVSVRVCVQVCKCVCICVSFQRAGGGDSPDRGALSSCPCTGLFSSQAINVTAASKAG